MFPSAYFRSINKLFQVSAEGSIEEGFADACKVIEQLHLDRAEELNEVKGFLHDRVDPYIKPMLSSLMKKRPVKVHEAIKEWLATEGETIRKNIETD